MKISAGIVFLISLMILSSTLLDIMANAQPGSQGPQPPSGYCNKKCGERCTMKGPGSRCMKYCLMCCAKCNCVPSGTFGNKDQCPCYRDWKSPNGRPKCP